MPLGLGPVLACSLDCTPGLSTLLTVSHKLRASCRPHRTLQQPPYELASATLAPSKQLQLGLSWSSRSSEVGRVPATHPGRCLIQLSLVAAQLLPDSFGL